MPLIALRNVLRWLPALTAAGLLLSTLGCVAPDRTDHSPDDEVDDSGGGAPFGDDDDLPPPPILGDDDDVAGDDDDIAGDDDDVAGDDDDTAGDDDDIAGDDDTSGAEGEGDIRLMDGSTPNEGRVEIFHAGQWGTVCDDSWGAEEALVVCMQLGFTVFEPTAVGSAGFGMGEDPIWLDNLNCSGQETSLADCPHNGWGEHNCGHSEDAGVVCE